MKTTLTRGTRAALLAVCIVGWPPAAWAGEAQLTIYTADSSVPPEGTIFSARCYFPPSLPTHEIDIEDCGSGLPFGEGLTISFSRNPEDLLYVSVAETVQEGVLNYYPGSGYSSCDAGGCHAGVGVYARQGSLHGHVSLPDGTPAVGATVFVYGSESRSYVDRTVTDGAGNYDFTKTDALSQRNHWGLGLGFISTLPATLQGWTVFSAVAVFGAQTTPPPFSEEFSRDLVRSSALTTLNLGIVRLEKAFNPNQTRPGTVEVTPVVATTDEPQACQMVPRPVDVVTGNVYLDQTDVVMAGIRGPFAFTRSYNSTRAVLGGGGMFGRGWEHSYEKAITILNDQIIRLERGSGLVAYLSRADGDSTYRPAIPASERSWIVRSEAGFTRFFKEGGSESYDASGRLVSQSDLVGTLVTFDRDEGGRLLSIHVAGGRSLNFGYSGGRVTSLSGPDDLIATYAYDGGGRLQSVEYGDGSGDTFAYDADGQLLSVVDAAGTTVERHTYAGGQGTSSEIADGRERYTLTYPGTSITQVVDSLGRTTNYELVEVAGAMRVANIDNCASCGGGESQHWEYDSDGRVTRHTNGNDESTSFTYDSEGRLATTTDPLDRTTSLTRDALGRILTRTTPDQAVTTWVHGPAGPLSVTDPIGRVTAFSYSPSGLLTSLTDGRGKTTTLEHDAFGDLTLATDPLSHTTRFEYDALGRRTTTTDPLDHTTTTTYDARGRVTRITQADATHVDFEYDHGGRRTRVTDAAGRQTRYAYDAYGRLTAVQDAAHGFTRYDYDLMSRLIALTDAKGQTTHFEYDVHDRLRKTRDPAGLSESYSYDRAGRALARTDRDGVVTAYGYDAAGRLLSKSYSDPTPPTSYGYDAADRLTRAANGADTLTWTYDAAGQFLSEASARNGSTVTYTYDAAGNRLSLGLDGSLFSAYSYDNGGQLVSIARGTSTFDFSHDAAGRRTSLSYPNGVLTTYSYDALSRLTQLRAVLGSTVITEWGYTYDAAGNRAGKSSPEFTETYGYDALSRLTSVDRAGLPKRWVYGYDAVGNRLSDQVDDSVVEAMSYNERNQLLSRSAGGPLVVRGAVDAPSTVTINGQPARLLAGNTFEGTIQASAGLNTFTVAATDAASRVRTSTYEVDITGSNGSYSYDPNGNLTQKTEGTDSWGYEWNATNQLKRVTNNGAEVARYSYDPLGRRVEKVAGGVTTNYVYDGMAIVKENRGGTIFTYIHGPAIDAPLAKETAGALTYFHADALGSVARVTDQSGATISSLRYDTWGNIESGTPDLFAFTGREWDPETNLYYYRARYYDPRIGRFLAEDPIGFGGGVNMYAYVGGNPGRFVDPSGTEFGDYWDVQATVKYYDNVSVTSPWVGFASIGSFMLSTFGMESAQAAGSFAGRGNYRCAAAEGILSVFEGLTLASPMLARSAIAGGPGMFTEARTFGTVSRNWWGMAEMSGTGARQVGTNWALDHWAITRAAGGSNAWWNLAAIPAGLNSFMNGAASTMWARYLMNVGILGSLGGGAIAGGWAALTQCGCGK